MKRHVPLVVILCVFAAAVGLTVGWGLPGPRRTELLFPGGASAEVLDEIAARSASKLAAQADEPIVLQGQRRPGAEPAWSRDEALDATRRFLLYSDNPDEMLALVALARMDPARLDFDPHMGQYGGAFLYPLGAWLKAASVVGLVRQGDLRFYLEHPEAFARLYVVGRLLVALCVAGAVVLVYATVLRLTNRAAATLAAGLLAFCPAVLTWSVVLKPHAAALLPVAAALYWSFACVEGPRLRTILLAAGAAGVAIGMTMAAWPVVLAVLAAFWMAERREVLRLAAGSAMVVAVAAAVFVVTNPYVVLSFADRVAEAQQVRRFYAGAVSSANPIEFAAGPLRQAVGMVFVLGAIFAAVLVGWMHPRRAAVLIIPLTAALVVIPFALGPQAGDPQTARFILPSLPLLLALVTLGLAMLPRLTAPTVAAAIVVMFALGLPTLVAQARSALGPGPREAAGRWLNDHPKATLLMEYPPAPYRDPPMDYLNRGRILFAADVGAQPYIGVRTTAGAMPTAEPGLEGTVVFRAGTLPEWLRCPMTFADRSVLLELYVGVATDAEAGQALP